MSFEGGGRLLFAGPRQHYRAAVRFAQKFADDGDTVGHGLTGPVDSLRQALAQGPVVIDGAKPRSA